MLEAIYDYDLYFKIWTIAVLRDKQLIKVIHCCKQDLQDYCEDIQREFGIMPRRITKRGL